MNVEIGAEAALFTEKEYISGIFIAVFALGMYTYLFGYHAVLYSCSIRTLLRTAVR
jgi:hypothetical protein